MQYMKKLNGHGTCVGNKCQIMISSSFGLQPGLSGSGSQPPGAQIFDLLRTVGYVGGSGFAKNSTAEGDGIKRAILGKDAW